MVVAFAFGITGMVKVKGEAEKEDNEGKLVGIFITKEPLESYITGKNGRLYAKAVEYASESDTEHGSKKYVFEGVEGISFFNPRIRDEASSQTYQNMTMGREISDSRLSYWNNEVGEQNELTGTIYVGSQHDIGAVYINCVYQSSKGDVYALSGESLYIGDASIEYAINEKKEKNEGASLGFEATVKVGFQRVDERITTSILQFGKNDVLLHKNEYAPEEVPQEMDVLSDTQYILVEETTQGGVERTLYQKKDTMIYTLYDLDNGFCAKHSCILNWGDR